MAAQRSPSASSDTIALISIIIPVFNEAENIAPLVDDIRQAITIPYEIIFVDDSSNDDTTAQITAAAEKHKNIKLISHPRNYGQSTALISGIHHASAATIATLDGDRQNDAKDIMSLFARYKADYADGLRLVIGWRRHRADTRLTHWSSRIANTVRRCILRDGTPDTGCGIKVFSRDVFITLPHFRHMHRYLPALFQRAGWQVRSLPVKHYPRRQGISKYGIQNRLWAGIIDIFGVWWLLRRLPYPPNEPKRPL